MKSELRIKVTDAAKLMGVSPETMRISLQLECYPFGKAIKTGKKRYTYVIIRSQFYDYVGYHPQEENPRTT